MRPTQKPSPPAVVFVDADNTLWDTDRVFAEAQLMLLDRVENTLDKSIDAENRLEFVRSIDQELAERHHAGLRYPARLLAQALAHALGGGFPPNIAVRRAWSGGSAGGLMPEVAETLEREFLDALRQIPRLRPGVGVGLYQLRSLGCLVLILTEGSRDKAKGILEHYGLKDTIDRVIEGPKSRRLFERVLALAHWPESAFMIGDQLDKDILPAKETGLATIFFPGGFRPKWTPPETVLSADYKIADFREAAHVIEAAIAKRSTTAVASVATNERLARQ
jgi:putative hydrolase of the HAD superfamily